MHVVQLKQTLICRVFSCSLSQKTRIIFQPILQCWFYSMLKLIEHLVRFPNREKEKENKW